MTPRKYITMLKTALFITVIASMSVKADLKQEIKKSCKDYQAGIDSSPINACKLYIDGFIDSAILSSTANVGEQSKSNKSDVADNAFFRRAFQTRLGQPVSGGSGDTTYEFCLPKDAERASIASKVAKSMDINELENRPLKFILFSALVKKYPC